MLKNLVDVSPFGEARASIEDGRGPNPGRVFGYTSGTARQARFGGSVSQFPPALVRILSRGIFFHVRQPWPVEGTKESNRRSNVFGFVELQHISRSFWQFRGRKIAEGILPGGRLNMCCKEGWIRRALD